MALKRDFKVILGKIYDCFVFFLWKTCENSEKLLIKMSKMHQCLFGVFSFHSGVNFGKIQLKFNNCSIDYYCTT